MTLQPRAAACFVSHNAFVEDERVTSFLVNEANGESRRYDVQESHTGEFTPPGYLVCRWTRRYRAAAEDLNSQRNLKMNAEALFLALADPATEPTAENTRLLQFLALMLERKKLLRGRGRTSDGAANRYEYVGTKQIFEIPAGELTPEFFLGVQSQLSVLFQR